LKEEGGEIRRLPTGRSTFRNGEHFDENVENHFRRGNLRGSLQARLGAGT
jgi:hypothetical protein